MIDKREDVLKTLHEYGLPDYMAGGIERYVFDHIKPGGFLVSILSNDFKMACFRADLQNRPVLPQWALFIHNEMPTGSHGSEEAVQEWLKKSRGR